MGLRARLIALVLVVSAAALIAVDLVLPLTTRSALIAGKDRTLTSVVDSLPSQGDLQQALAQVTRENPLAGDIGWSQVSLAGLAKVLQTPAGHPTDNPAVGTSPPVSTPVTVRDASGSGDTYRILAGPPLADRLSGAPTGYLVAWVPLSDVQSTIGRLVLLELLISLGLLVLVGVVSGLAIRRALRPLETMARVADGIAGGDLSRRVDPGPPGTEVGRLGIAFNGMVDGVSDLLAERAKSEQRLRQFVADASHELRTPVAAIRGYTDLYRAGALPEEVAVRKAMDRMGFESRRMGALVEDLLTLTHTDAETAAPTERVDLAPLLTGVVDDAAVIDRSRVWRLAGTATYAVVLGDRLRLHQLFANLLANVRTHTPAGTTATVSVTESDLAVPGGGGTVGMVSVAVIDNGPGVADEHLPRLFDRFFRADSSRSREHGGSGLGLSIVAAIVRTHRGRITASRTPGGGLTVTVFLPAAPRTDPRMDARTAARSEAPPAARSDTRPVAGSDVRPAPSDGSQAPADLGDGAGGGIAAEPARDAPTGVRGAGAIDR